MAPVSWPSGELCDNLILPMTLGNVKPISFYSGLLTEFTRAQGRAELQAARSNRVQPGSESQPERSSSS